ncbi:MAG: histidine kinase, partial [Firmicutes bacterium]|nr:histidine kinase [Bacillota bacterium]
MKTKVKKDQSFRFPLQAQMLLLYVFIGLIPVILICFYFSSAVRDISISQTSEAYRHSVNQVGKNLLEGIAEMAQAASNTGNEEDVVAYLSDYSEDDYLLYERYANTVHDLFRQLQYRFKNLRVHIYTPNNNIKFSGTFIRDKMLFEQQEQAVTHTDGLFIWNGIRREYGKDYLVACTPIKNFFTGGNTVGVLEIGINLNDLYAFIDEATSSGTAVLLLDQNNQVLLSSLQNEEENEEVLQLLQTAGANDIVSWHETDYLIFQSDIENAYLGISQWKNVHLVPMKVMEEGAHEIRMTGFTITCVLALFAFTLLVIFARGLTYRLQLLTNTMNRIEDGHSAVLVPVTGHDEIFDLGMHFDKMIKRLHFLMNEIYENEIKKQKLENEQKTAQLIALQNQINPHYLFNTMETIRMNLLLKGDTETAGVIRMFADSFREMIDDSELTCRLRDELEFVKKYFQVQKYRYEEKIDLMISADESVMNAVIPKFLLQPMVENSIYHGL